MKLFCNGLVSSRYRNAVGRILSFAALLLPATVAAQGASAQGTASGTASNATLAAFEAAFDENPTPSDSTEERNSQASGGVTMPVADGPSSVTAQSVALPSGAGTPLGMGESFSAQLSTG